MHHSTETALVKVTNDLLIALDKELVPVFVLLDLCAAFETIERPILLENGNKNEPHRAALSSVHQIDCSL